MPQAPSSPAVGPNTQSSSALTSLTPALWLVSQVLKQAVSFAAQALMQVISAPQLALAEQASASALQQPPAAYSASWHSPHESVLVYSTPPSEQLFAASAQEADAMVRHLPPDTGVLVKSAAYVTSTSVTLLILPERPFAVTRFMLPADW